MKFICSFLFLNISFLLFSEENINKQAIDPAIIFLFIFCIFIFGFGIYFGIKVGKSMAKSEFKQKIPDIRQDAISRSRSVLTGLFSEQLAPYLPDFPYLPTEARFVGKPIDFLIFKGLDEKNVSEVIFVEVKSGKSKLSTTEKTLKDAIINGNVRWEEYRIPDRLTE